MMFSNNFSELAMVSLCYYSVHYTAGTVAIREEVVPVEVKDNNDGSYSASFVTKHVGEVKLSVTIKGQHIKGSPYSIMVCV